MKLDNLDINILNILREDAKLTVKQVAKLVKKPLTTVHTRIKKLEEEKIIRRYTIIPDHDALGNTLSAFVLISVASVPGKNISQKKICSDISKRKEVESVNIVTGNHDIVLKVRVANIRALNTFITRFLRNIEGIDKTQTMMILDEIE